MTEFIKALWDYNDELRASPAPLIATWTRKVMVNVHAFLPYHPAAVRFYREKGVWSRKMEARQEKLLSGKK